MVQAGMEWPGQPVVMFSRKLKNRAGGFNGALAASVSPRFLASFDDKGADTENDVLSVVSKKGELIASTMGGNIGGDGAPVLDALVFAEKQREAFFMTIVSMAHILGVQVAAEGVETLQQLTILQGLRCNEVQGCYVSRPVPAANLPALLGLRYLFPRLESEVQAA